MQSKTNILFIESTSGYGGSSKSLNYMLKYLDKNKYKLNIAIRDRGNQITDIDGVEVFKLETNINKKYLIDFIKECFFIRNILIKQKIDIIHINTNIYLGSPSIFAAFLTKTHCVCHLREIRALTKREIFFIRFVDELITLNNDGFQNYIKFIPKEKLNIIPNGIELEQFDFSSNKHKLNTPFELEHPSVGLIGRIVEGKGHKEVLLAAKEVVKEIPNVKFYIIGDSQGSDSHYYEYIKEYIVKEKLQNNVIFTGWVDDIRSILRHLDVVIQGSTTFKEGLSNVIIESMAAGKPIIVTDIPGQAEFVLEDETGFIVRPGDVEELKERIFDLIRNKDKAQQMGVAGRKKAEEIFDIKKIIPKIEKLYSKILN